MINLLRKVLSKFQGRKKPDVPYKPILTEEQAAELQAALHPPAVPPTPPAPVQPKGRIIKQTRAAEYNPNTRRSGGRIVRAMPRQLQKMKQAQEAEENPVESLED